MVQCVKRSMGNSAACLLQRCEIESPSIYKLLSDIILSYFGQYIVAA